MGHISPASHLTETVVTRLHSHVSPPVGSAGSHIRQTCCPMCGRLEAHRRPPDLDKSITGQTLTRGRVMPVLACLSRRGVGGGVSQDYPPLCLLPERRGDRGPDGSPCHLPVAGNAVKERRCRCLGHPRRSMACSLAPFPSLAHVVPRSATRVLASCAASLSSSGEPVDVYAGDPTPAARRSPSPGPYGQRSPRAFLPRPMGPKLSVTPWLERFTPVISAHISTMDAAAVAPCGQTPSQYECSGTRDL